MLPTYIGGLKPIKKTPLKLFVCIKTKKYVKLVQWLNIFHTANKKELIGALFRVTWPKIWKLRNAVVFTENGRHKA